ncbi:MAG: hypothetical protein KAG61_03985 [Bacteriovoracaceae bacterium]|nr:hypothetical protein [Bacteriovoracaceae bacterium]
MKPLENNRKISTLLIIYGFVMQMILAPLAMAEECNYEEGSSMAADQDKCLSSEGQRWSCSDHKCVYDDTTTAMQDAHNTCEGIEDPDELKKCVDSVALGAGQEDGMTNVNYADKASMGAEMLGWANLIFGALNGGATSTCLSTTIMKWTGYAQTAADLYAYFMLSDKVRDLHEEYNESTVADNNYDAQRDAFEFLKKEQETIQSVAKQRKLIYMVATAGYTAAAGVALYESYGMFTGKVTCTWASTGAALACAEAAAAEGITSAKGDGKIEGGYVGDDDNTETDVETDKPDVETDKIKWKKTEKGWRIDNGPAAIKSDNIIPDLSWSKAGNNALSTFSEMSSWQELANQAREASRKVNIDRAKENFHKLPENTRKTTVFNLKAKVNEANQFEVAVANTQPSDANYKDMIKDIISKWRQIQIRAAEIGDSETTDRAAQKATYWQEKLNSLTKVEVDSFKVFALLEPEFNTLDSNYAFSAVESTSTDLNAYIAYKEWNDFNNGQVSSFDLRSYDLVKASSPKSVSFGMMSFKASMLYMIKFSIIQEANANSKIGGLAKGMAVGAAKSFALKFALCTLAPTVAYTLSGWLQTPPAVAVMATASAAVNMALASVAGKEEKQAKNNAKIIEKVLGKFEASQATFCPNGRDDLEKPECYCYESDGRTSARGANSDICAALWDKNGEKDLFSKSGNYDRPKAGGCSYINGNIDLDCKCKDLIDSSTRVNACQKVPKTSERLSAAHFPGFATSVSKIGNFVESMGNGAASTGEINTQEVQNAIQTQKKINDVLLKGLNNKLKRNGKSPLKLNTPAAMKRLVKGMVPNKHRSRLMKAKLRDTGKSKSSLGPKARSALASAIKKSGIQYSSGKKQAGEKDNFAYDFNDVAPAGSAGKVMTDGSFINKKYKYNNEINKNKGASIFEIISRRYTVSGMKRLFGDK